MSNDFSSFVCSFRNAFARSSAGSLMGMLCSNATGARAARSECPPPTGIALC